VLTAARQSTCLLLGLAAALSVVGMASAQGSHESPPPAAPAGATPPGGAPPTTFSLELVANGCSTTDTQLAAAISVRVPAAERVETAAEVALHAEIVNGGTSSLLVSLAQGSSRREFQGASCDEAAAIIAFISSLVLDARPEERLKATELAAVPEPTDASRPKAEDKPAPTPEPVKPPSPTSVVDEGETARAGTRPRFGVSAAFTLETAVAPTPPPGGLFGLNLRWERSSWLSPELRAELLVTGSATKAVTGGGKVSLRLTAGRLSACPVRLRALKGALQLALCATFDAGFLHGQGDNSHQGQPNSMLWLAGGTSVLVEIPVSEAFELQLLAGVKRRAGSDTFTLTADPQPAPPLEVYTPPPFSGGFAVGVGFRL
jgi:hypothetical protein